MTSILVFLKTLPAKLWGYLAVAGGLVMALVYFYFSTKNKGKVEAETKAKIDDLSSKVVAHQELTKDIVAGAIAIDKIESEINALPPSAVAERARKWVRNRPKD